MTYLRKQTLGRYGGGALQPSVQPYTFPASVMGIDAVSSLMQMDPECTSTSTLAFNLGDPTRCTSADIFVPERA